MPYLLRWSILSPADLSSICAIPESAAVTAIPAPCSSCCANCCNESGNYPFYSVLSPGDIQSVLFSESGAWIKLEYTLSLNGTTVEGEEQGQEEPVLICISIQYGGTPPSGSVSSGGFYASYNASNWGPLPAGGIC